MTNILPAFYYRIDVVNALHSDRGEGLSALWKELVRQESWVARLRIAEMFQDT